MLRLGLILHLFIASTIMGCFMVAALVAGFDTMMPVIWSCVAGFFVSIPVSWMVTKAIYNDE